MFKFFVNLFGGLVLGGQNTKKWHFAAFLAIWTPKNTPSHFFDPKLIDILFSRVANSTCRNLTD